MKRQDWMTDAVYAWDLLEEQSRLRTLKRKQLSGNRALILVKAQDPLTIPDGKPGPEYTERLEEALAIKASLEAKGMKPRFLCVGGVHDESGVSLAEAGRAWLLAHGVDDFDIETQEVIFSGNDEDRIAAIRFDELGDRYRELHVVLSAGQFERCRMYFIYAGWQPTMHPITFVDDDPRHHTTRELWGPWAIPAFAEGPARIEAETEKIRQKHLAAANNS